MTRVNRRKNIRRGRSGNAIIETALGMLTLLGLVYGMVEFGQYFYIKNAFQAAARDGCRMSILPTATQAVVVSTMTSTLQGANVTYSGSWLTINDITLSGSTTAVGSITSVPSGDAIQIKLATNYATLPVAFRPLYSFTAGRVGIGNKLVTGMCTMIKE